MNLRLSSATIKRRMDDNDETFKQWKFQDIDSTELKQLTEDIEEIKGGIYIINFI